METPYDRFSYPGSVYSHAHINRFAAVAFLHGIRTPELRTCRVLELGCNRGLHLIGMAQLYPDAQFVGIDLSESSIARAVELAGALELKNVSFRAMDLTQLSGRAGECDYLIAHGVYSWVPQSVREKLFEICGHVLADNGVAFINYNTYPGAHLRELITGMISIHTAGLDDPVEKVSEGAALVSTVLRALGDESPYAPALKSETEALLGKNPLVAYFDEFSPDSTPVYFSDFIRHASAHGLQFLAEAEVARMTADRLPVEARELLDGLSDVVLREQYTDFFKLTRFRQTLLCRDTLMVDREGLEERIQQVYIATPVQPSGEIQIKGDAPMLFVSQTGASITVNQPFVKAVLYELALAWPARLLFPELLDRALRRLEESQPDAAEMLVKTLFKMLTPNLLEIDLHPYPFPAHPSGKPVATKLARLQAASGTDVVSLRHNVVDLDDPAARDVLRLLDGTRDRRAILDSVRLSGREVTAAQLEQMLNRMAALSLLVA
jgi:methyltransferase-like protein